MPSAGWPPATSTAGSSGMVAALATAAGLPACPCLQAGRRERRRTEVGEGAQQQRLADARGPRDKERLPWGHRKGQGLEHGSPAHAAAQAAHLREGRARDGVTRVCAVSCLPEGCIFDRIFAISEAQAQGGATANEPAPCAAPPAAQTRARGCGPRQRGARPSAGASARAPARVPARSRQRRRVGGGRQGSMAGRGCTAHEGGRQGLTEKLGRSPSSLDEGFRQTRPVCRPHCRDGSALLVPIRSNSQTQQKKLARPWPMWHSADPSRVALPLHRRHHIAAFDTSVHRQFAPLHPCATLAWLGPAPPLLRTPARQGRSIQPVGMPWWRRRAVEPQQAACTAPPTPAAAPNGGCAACSPMQADALGGGFCAELWASVAQPGGIFE